MSQQNLIEAAGGHAQKETHFVPLFTSRFLAGYYTNRSLLRSPLQSLYSDFYHIGATDTLCDGLNSELSVRQTIIRRPGNPLYCTAETAAAIDDFYSFQRYDGTIQVIADSVADVEVVTPTTITSIFTKSTGAGESYFEGIVNTLYIVDGVDTVQYVPDVETNPNTGNNIWNFGGVAPTVPPVLKITETGSAGVQWEPDTIWSTMGFIVDSNGNVQQMVSVNASGTNTTQLGSTGSGAPAFSQTPGGTQSGGADGTITTWTNWGPIGLRLPNATYTNGSVGGTLSPYYPCIIYDPVSNSCYINANPLNLPGITSTNPNRPAFTGVFKSVVQDGGVKWVCLGNPSIPQLWKSGTLYTHLGAVSYNDGGAGVSTPITPDKAGLGTPAATTVFWQVSSGGTSAASSYFPNWSTGVGDPTSDGDIIWNCLGTATRANTTNYVPWSSGSNNFSVIEDTVSGTLQVCISATGPSGSSTPTFAAIYGQQTQDGTNAGTTNFVGVTWVCVGTSLSWAPNTQWYLPVGGFVPPQPSQPYGGATLVDTNNNNQYVTNSGKSGSMSPYPDWGAIGQYTTDGTVTWYALDAFTAAGFSWSVGYGYCYAYKSRTATDIYVLTSPPLQIPGTNSPNITGPLGNPTGNQDGSVTTASPVTQIVGGNTGAQILITMQGSTDPQFDTIEVYRSADSFGSSGPYLFLTDIPMPPVVGGVAGTAQIIDFMPDLAGGPNGNNGLPGLDTLITAPINNVNDPPPGAYGSTQFVASALGQITPKPGTTLIGIVYHQGRLWGFIGSSVFASGGPDTVVGNGFTAWPPAYEFPFNSPVIRLEPTPTALVVFTTNGIFLIGGGPAITDYYSQPLDLDIGVLSYNAIAMVHGIPHMFSSDRELVSIDPGGGITRIGHPIADKISSFNPADVYLVHHHYGDADHVLFISDGSSQWYRCDPNPTPDSQLTGPVWSPRATISGGFQAIASIVTAPGVRQLLIGPARAGYILARDSSYTTFVDNVSPYESYFTMGNIVLAHPGQMAELAFVEMDFTQLGTQPVVSVLFDELGATNGAAFEKISNSFVSDPPKLYGPTAVPDTLWMNRYYFGQTETAEGEQEPITAWCKHMQIMVDFGNTDEVENELLAFTIFGALFQEK